MSTSLASLVDSSFRWDGTTSDIAQQLLRRHLKNDVAPKLSPATSTLPTAIQSRLDTINLTFDALPGLLQRAVVWDSGYVLTEQVEFVKVQTLNGIAMAKIAVSEADYGVTAKCTPQQCTQPDGTKWQKNGGCSGTDMLTVSKCFVESFPAGQDPGKSMWSTGGNDSATPWFRVLNHTWTQSGTRYEVAAIHTAESRLEPKINFCGLNTEDASTPGVGSIVIPCSTPSTVTSTMKAQMKAPAQSKLVTTWLEAFAASKTTPSVTPATVTDAPAPTLATAPISTTAPVETVKTSAPNSTTVTPTATTPAQVSSSSSSKGFNAMFVVIPVVVIVIFVIVAFLWCRRRRNNDNDTEPKDTTMLDTASGVDQSPFLPPPINNTNGSKGSRPSEGGPYSTVSTNTTGSSRPSGDQNPDAAYTSALQILLRDRYVMDKQVPSQEIELADPISKGAYGEVWVGYCSGQLVAIKRLLRSKHHSAVDLEAFALEIQLSARLHHPNIVRFIGASWDNVDSMILIMEYLPAGDLSKVLRTSGDKLTWERHKLSMARGLVSAVAYLHDQSPTIIHRDIKSKNVLLSDVLEPKLIDFGVSRRMMDETMTAGVGTPFWTAPEVLEGKRYTEKSDIYSLGVVLTELDTHHIPYHDMLKGDGGMMHLKILNDVIAGKLRPSITDDCPDTIRRVIISCLRQDPDTRPTAQEILWMLA